MASENNISISGELPPPAGKYAVTVSDNFITVVSLGIKLEIRIDYVSSVCVGWAVPAKGGGYICLSLQFKDGTEKVLLMSEGYDADILKEYRKTGSELATALKLGLKEVPLGADA